MENKIYAAYSQRHTDLGFGSSVYLRPDDTRIEVSSVGSDPDLASFMWPDKVLLGEVTRYIGPGKPYTGKLFLFEGRSF